VKRDSPQSRLHRAAPSLPVPAPLVFGRAEQHAKKTFAWTSTEPQGSGTRATLERAPKGFARGHGRCAGKRRSTSARVGTVSECRSRSDASPVATPVGATKRTSDTRDLARRIAGARQGNCERSSEDGARTLEAFSNHGDADWSKPHAQASSGSHPEGCGLGDSGSPRAASAR